MKIEELHYCPKCGTDGTKFTSDVGLVIYLCENTSCNYKTFNKKNFTHNNFTKYFNKYHLMDVKQINKKIKKHKQTLKSIQGFYQWDYDTWYPDKASQFDAHKQKDKERVLVENKLKILKLIKKFK